MRPAVAILLACVAACDAFGTTSDPPVDAGRLSDPDASIAGDGAVPTQDGGGEVAGGGGEAGAMRRCDPATCAQLGGVCNVLNGVCQQACIAGRKCSGALCPPGAPCEITCNGGGSCDGISCGDASTCTIACNSSKACKNTACGQARSCTVTCSEDACGGDLSCPATPQSTCTVTCSARCDVAVKCCNGAACAFSSGSVDSQPSYCMK